MSGSTTDVLLLAGSMLAVQAAEERPLWQGGAGVAAFGFPAGVMIAWIFGQSPPRVSVND